MDDIIRNVVNEWQGGIRVVGISPLTPDASLRRYFRIALEGSECVPQTIVAMVFDSLKCAEVDGGEVLNCDEAYVRLTELLRENSVAVPELYFRNYEPAILLIEDLGDRLLATALRESVSGDVAGGEVLGVDAMYRRAVDELVKIHSVVRPAEHFALSRSFTKSLYVKEMNEFKDFLQEGEQDKEWISALLEGIFESIASELMVQENVLSHRDFHSWNLLVDSGGNIRVIDFQDALLAPRCYDLVALLNDRDTDVGLGARRYDMLLKYFCEKTAYGSSFDNDYRMVLLQRDLKVVGRFFKLATQRGLVSYKQWIPGTLRRIGVSLNAIVQNVGWDTPFGDLLNLVQTKIK
ncbi:MAG: phosphotransferase [Deltaproteobacteria bacterium]|nr:phosphotransferase [Deltaproteobacteria bacterium]